MIMRLSVSDHRVLRSVTCSLERFTLFVGPNGCGKSTLLEALARMSDLPQPSGTVTRPGALGAAPMTEVSTSPPWTELVTDGQAPTRDDAPIVTVLTQLDAARLRAPSPLHERIEVLGPDGSGLAGLLADWKLGDDPRLGTVLEQLRQVAPSIRNVLPRRTEQGYEIFVQVGPDARLVPARHISTGTLHALALLTLLQSLAGRSALVLIDDIDQNLHPRAQAELVVVLRAVLDANPGLQIVATGHSPYLLDHMQPDEVRLMALDDQGLGHVASLTEHPEFERWRGVMLPGEFWSSVGDAWVLRSSASARAAAESV